MVGQELSACDTTFLPYSITAGTCRFGLYSHPQARQLKYEERAGFTSNIMSEEGS